jgi:hypothetical protein
MTNRKLYQLIQAMRSATNVDMSTPLKNRTYPERSGFVLNWCCGDVADFTFCGCQKYVVPATFCVARSRHVPATARKHVRPSCTRAVRVHACMRLSMVQIGIDGCLSR